MAAMKIVPLILLCVAASATEIRISGGALDDQVFPRDAANRADIALSGSTDAQGAVEARVTRKHLVISGWSAIGQAASGKWSGTVKGLAAGGPYKIEVRAGGASTAVSGILVGDLWVLAGQSNMQGVGDLVNTEMPHELVHNFDMADQWQIAEEPLHTLATALDPVHWAKDQTAPLSGDKLKEFLSNRRKGAGLGLPFAVEMVRRTGIPIGLVSRAHGGTSMDQWDPSLKSRSGDSLYGSMFRGVQVAGVKVTGVLWYQGESDASPKAAPEFQAKFERLVSAMREDFNLPTMPFYYVQIGRHVANQNQLEWNMVQESQRIAESTIRNSGMVAAVDLSLDDGIHVSTPDLKRLGKRLANLATGETKRGPRPVSATFQKNVVRVSFSDVNGRLRSAGRIAGFSIHGADGAPLPLIYRMQVDPADGSAILLSIGGKMPEGAALRYGFGRDPYCNVRDDADMALPVFGPMAIQQ
jgi:sialate O-acetylesterase